MSTTFVDEPDDVVAPFTGAWIEIINHSSSRAAVSGVAPFTGAWIEISVFVGRYEITKMSHPSRVRGLKFSTGFSRFLVPLVAPFTGAWIEMSKRVEKKESA